MKKISILDPKIEIFNNKSSLAQKKRVMVLLKFVLIFACDNYLLFFILAKQIKGQAYKLNRKSSDCFAIQTKKIIFAECPETNQINGLVKKC